MDNSKTGALIRRLRRERGLTQRELASGLSVTDRAVSKWERGLCAPDISLLEPLSEALGCSVAELIAGETDENRGGEESLSDSEKAIIDYSVREMNRRMGIIKKRYMLGISLAAVFILGCILIPLWLNGYFFVTDSIISPDGLKTLTVYDREPGGNIFADDSVFVVTDLEGGSKWRVKYGDCEYKGAWWSPDSQKYVLMLQNGGSARLTLSWLERNSQSNLNAYLTMGVEMTELSRRGYVLEEGWPDIDYQFLQWAEDSESMLIYYSFQDTGKNTHSGYFWYNCVDCTVSALLETA